MKFFVDTANVDEIKKANDMGIICGVTTNPSLIAKEGRDFGEVIDVYKRQSFMCCFTSSTISWTNASLASLRRDTFSTRS